VTGRPNRPSSAVSLGLAVLLLGSAAGILALKLRSEEIARARAAGSGLRFLPPGRTLKAASLGYSSLLADIIYIWAIQYFSDPSIADRYSRLDHIFGVISDLDPKYSEPYLIGALIAAYEAREPRLALKVLDRAMKKNPGDWVYPFEAGHYAQMMMKDYGLAREYYRRAKDLPGAPDIARRLYADALFKSEDYETSWKTWLEVHASATDDRVRKIASNHLYQVKAARDIAAVREAVERYRERFGRRPANLGQLVRAGLLPSLPRDLDDRDYIYDPRSGEISTAVIPWKR
jgi:tetratricopeptide (TPR) repeat protein